MSHPVLDYPELTEEYESRLEKMERGFQMDQEFLMVWVPDEDHKKSLSYLFEAASLHGESALEVRIKTDLMGEIDGEGLVSFLSSLGAVTVDRNQGRTCVLVRFGESAQEAVQIDEVKGLTQFHSSYRERLERVFHNMSHGVEADPSLPNQMTLEILGHKVFLEMNGAEIRSAAHQEREKGAESALLETLCRVAAGSTLQDMAEHGAIRTENHLRDLNRPPVSKGLITPSLAGPQFLAIQEAFRGALKTQQDEAQRNAWEPQIASPWQGLNDLQRKGRALEEVQAFVQKSDPAFKEVEFLNLIKDREVYIDFPDGIAEALKSNFVVRLERHLKAELEPSIEVYLPTAEDRAKRNRRSTIVDRGAMDQVMLQERKQDHVSL